MRRFVLSLFMASLWIAVLAQKPNIAPGATVTCTGLQAPFPPSALNDLNFGTCGTQLFWMTSTSGSTTDYIEWTWATPQSFDEITFYQADNVPSRQLVGGVLQSWDGTQWVNEHTFANLPLACDNNITFNRITTTKMRMTQMVIGAPGATQFTNVNFREIEIFQASTAEDDAGVISTNSVPAVCPGSFPVEVTIQNFGTNRIDSVLVNWEMDGVAQVPVMYNVQLDTLAGMGNSSAVVLLGNYTFAANQTYNLKSWTSLPNNANDTANFNDTLNASLALAAPNGLAITNLASQNADVVWNMVAGTNYGLVYGPAGFNPQTGGTNVLPATSPYSIAGLSPVSSYDVYVYANCGGGVFSDTAGPVSFSTLIKGPEGVNCDTIGSTVVLFEEFDTQGGWTGDIGTGATAGDWNYNSGPTGSLNTGPSGAHSGTNYIYYESGGAGPASLVSPGIDLSQATDSAELSFWMHAYGASIGELLVKVSTTSAAGPFSDTVFFYNQGQLQTSESDPWQQVGVRLDQYIGQVIWLEFEADRISTFTGDLALDLVKVEACGDICLPPFAVDSILPQIFSAQVYVDTATGTSYSYEWGPCGFNQGTGTSATGGSSINLTGLQPNTCYDLYISKLCTGGSSIANKFSFRTGCLFIAPYVEDFEDYTPGQFGGQIEGCISGNKTVAPRWETEDASGANENSLNTGPFYDNTLYPTAGGIYLFLETSGGGLNDSDWFETPIIDISALANPYVSFAYHMYGSQMGNLRVQYTDDQSGWQNLVFISGPQQTAGNDPWQFAGDSILNIAGDSIRLRFIGYRGNGFESDMSVDDITIDEAPLCAPSNSFSVINDSTTATSGFVVWNSGAGSKYQVVWGPFGFDPTLGGFGQVSVTDTFFSLNPLTPQTTYDVYVRDSCSAGYSNYIGPITFSTLCTGTTMPYYESFDVWPLSCWLQAGGSEPWIEFNTATSDNYAEADFWGLNGDSIVMSTRPITITQDAQVRFYWSHFYSTVYPDDELIVRVREVGGQWDTLLTLKGPVNFHDPTAGNGSGQPGSFIEEEVVLDPTIYTGKNVIVQLWANSDFGPDLFVNDFYVEPAPTCPDLTGLDTLVVTDTSATLTWNSSTKASQYQVWYGPQGFFQGTSSGGIARVLTSGSTLVLSGLNSQFCYEYVVRSICTPGDTSDWEGPFIFCTDLGYDLELVNLLVPEGCGSMFSNVEAVIRNNGDNSISNFPISVTLTGTHPNVFNTTYTSTLNSGNMDTVLMGTINTVNGALISYDAYVSLTNDQIGSNDSLQLDSVAVIPLDPVAYDTTVCMGQDTAYLSALPVPGVIYNWYASQTDTVPIFSGNPLKVATTGALSTYYVGYSNDADSLTTTFAAGNGQSGNMFDVIPKKALNLQGFTVSPQSTGLQNFEVYYKVGPYLGSETNAAAWTLLGSIPVTVPSPVGPTYVPLPATLQLNTGVTYAFYVTGTTTSVNYTNGSTAGSLYSSNSDLEFYEGIGLAYPFGGSFSPRIFNGRIHYGSAGCSNTRKAVNLTTGSDTAVAAFTSANPSGNNWDFDASATVNGDHYAWDFGDGSNGTGMMVSHSYPAVGNYNVVLTVSDSTDCYSTDVVDTSIVITIGLGENALSRYLLVYPNPTNDVVNIELEWKTANIGIKLFDMSGKEILQTNAKVENGAMKTAVDLSAIADGAYFLEISDGEAFVRRKVVKQ